MHTDLSLVSSALPVTVLAFNEMLRLILSRRDGQLFHALVPVIDSRRRTAGSGQRRAWLANQTSRHSGK